MKGLSRLCRPKGSSHCAAQDVTRPREAGAEAPHQHHLEIQQLEPVAQPPRIVKTRPGRKRPVAQAQALAQPPQAPGVEAQDQQAPAVVEDPAGLAQHVVRRAREFQGVRQQHRIHALALHRQPLGSGQGLGVHLADGADHCPVRHVRGRQQALAAAPVADLQDVPAEQVRHHQPELAFLQRQHPPPAAAAQPQLEGVAGEGLAAPDRKPVGHGLTLRASGRRIVYL